MRDETIARNYAEALFELAERHEGVEADDVIGTLTRQAEAAGLPVVIASSDKDFFQLIVVN